MAKHKSLFVLISTALLGLWFYILGASFTGWLPSIWWGGEALIAPILGSFYVSVISLIYYFFAKAFRKISILSDAFLWQLAIAGIVMGFMFFPCVVVFGHVDQFIPNWGKLPDLLAINLGLIISGLISSILSCLVIIILEQFRKETK